MPDAFIKGARMKRNNPDSIQKVEILRNNLSDSLLSKAEKQIFSDKLELRLDNILKEPGSTFDYLLKDGDRIIIPEVSQEVRISGEIQNPIGLAYQKGKKLKYYINRSGGFNDNAQKRKTFVIYSDGTTEIARNFFGRHYPNIQPGSQIIVPQKPEKQRIDNTGKWLGIASTMATIAVAIATLVKL